MGVCNITPDSFSDGGKFYEPAAASRHAMEMIDAGADILDFGGQSTRPGSESVGAEEELRRVLPVLKEVRKKSDVWISIDTYRQDVAQMCLNEGADMVNDVSSFRLDPQMPLVVSAACVPVVCMHFLKSIHPMPSNPEYQDLLGELLTFFRETFHLALAAGIKQEQIVVDPGIGFGKTLEHNLRIIKELTFLNVLDRPILAGPSRKSFIGKITGKDAANRLEGTAAAVGQCVANGAHIIRVHDVAFFRQYCDVLDAILA